MNIANLVTTLRLDNAKFHADLKRSNSMVKSWSAKVNKSLARSERRWKKFNNTMLSTKKIIGVLAGGYLLKKMAGGFTETAASFEQMELKLNALTKGKGKETLDAINEWALKMPVNTEKAVDTFVMMKAMGLDPNIEAMETLVDVSVLFGEDTMPRVARALGQMQTLGKLSAEELNQLSEAGINARKYLNQAFGTAVGQDINKMGISIEKVIDTIMTGLKEDFGGSAREAMNTWQGVTAYFESTWTEIKREFADAGAFDAAKDAITSIADSMSDWLETQKELKEMGLSNWFDNIASAAENLAAATGKIAKAASLRSIAGTFAKGLELSKKGQLGISFQEFIAMGAFERQAAVDKALAGLRPPDLSKAIGRKTLDRMMTPIKIDMPDLSGAIGEKTIEKLGKVGEEYNKHLNDIKDRYKQSAFELATIDMDTFDQRRQSVMRWADEYEKDMIDAQMWTNEMKQAVKDVGQVELKLIRKDEFINDINEMTNKAEGFFDTFSDSIKNAISEGRMSFKSLAAAFGTMIADMILESEKAKFLEGFKETAMGHGSVVSSVLGGIQNMFQHGGWINEPVVGVGTRSGESYSFAEHGAEFVSPGGMGSNNFSISIHAVDAKSFLDLTRSNPGAIVDPWLKSLRRGGSLRNNMRGVM